MLEPRRLAATSAARFMAQSLGEKVGETVGYRIRGDSKVSPRTKIEVVTEGILTKLLQEDQSLTGIATVIFDEFHERSVNADIGLAFALEIQRTLRNDLKLLVMSATIETDQTAKLLGLVDNPCPIIKCAGSSFPVSTIYLPPDPREADEVGIARAVFNALKDDEGDLLVFLPGKAEIGRVEGRLRDKFGAGDAIEVCPLYGEASEESQRKALQPATSGVRKVILATTIAETSLTIDGVRVVIDSGLTRVPRYDVRRGMTELQTTRVSEASAHQRRGRAGRQAEGKCYRLWSEGEALLKFLPPEITTTDLVPLALEVALWGAESILDFSLLDYPSEGSWSSACSSLQTLGALDGENRITKHGREIASLGMHPRLGHMILSSRKFDGMALACEISALLEERDIFSGRPDDIELSARWYALRQSGGNLRGGAAARVRQQSDRLKQKLQCQNQKSEESRISIGALVALAYPERLALQRSPNSRRYLLRNGTGAELPEKSILGRSKFLAIASLDGGHAHARIFLAEPIEESEVLNLYSHQVESAREVYWDSVLYTVRAREIRTLSTLVLNEVVVEPTEEELLEALVIGLKATSWEKLPWSESSKSFIARSDWVKIKKLVSESWPSFSKKTLQGTLEEWLAPYCFGKKGLGDLSADELDSAVRSRLTRDELKTLANLAPSHYRLPTGTEASIDYSNPDQPSISVYLQEMFGASVTPAVGEGSIPLTVHLLSPAKRPLQVTKDLASFWKNTYVEVRKEMMGRYPKHHWPVDPLTAAPTSRAKRRRKRSTP